VIANMPHPRPPFLHRQITRHGRAVWYVRVAKGKRIRLRAEYGSPEFWAALSQLSLESSLRAIQQNSTRTRSAG